MNGQTSAGFSRFHAIVAATPRDGFGPPVINSQFFQSTSYATASDTPSAKKRKRDTTGSSTRNPTTRSSVRHSKLYEGRQQLLSALRDHFQQGPDVEFHGCYEMEEAGVSHKQRIQTLTNEIWRTTGYRFTVKDHPKINNGHKTRFWCSQDQAHKNKLKGARIAGDVPKPRLTSTGDVMAKTRYPCRSRLLISSRDSDVDGRRVVTIRLAHHVAHEPYLDASLPPEVSKTLYESFGWYTHENGVDTNFSDGSSGRRQSSFMTAVGDDQLAIAVAPSQLHEPSQLFEMEEDDEDDEELGPDEEEDETESSGGPINAFSSQPVRDTSPPCLIRQPRPPIPPPIHSDIYHQRMRCHIANIREFCDGLDYQLQFNDTRMLEAVEKEGGSFLHLVEDCLRKEGRLVSVPSGHHVANGVVTALGPTAIPSTSNSGMEVMLNGVNGFG